MEGQNKRMDFVNKYTDQDTFFIQNGFVGNSVLWWAKGGRGYTTDLLKAQEYTKEEVMSKFVNGREEDRIWLACHIRENIRITVDAQYLDYDQYCAQ